MIIKSFVFSRLICNVANNALNKIFNNLGRDIKRLLKENDDNDYVEILKFILASKKASQRCPNDDEFRYQLTYRDIYNMKGSTKKYLL